MLCGTGTAAVQALADWPRWLGGLAVVHCIALDSPRRDASALEREGDTPAGPAEPEAAPELLPIAASERRLEGVVN